MEELAEQSEIIRDNFINLYGHIEKVITRDRNIILFVFVDNNRGELLCKVRNNCILFYTLDKRNNYYLQAELKSFTKINEDDETVYLNDLIIKRASIIK